MSANNWTACPQCKANAEAAAQARFRRAARLYGKVSQAEYADLARKAAEPIKLGDTLREDWEFGLSNNGEFLVRYYANCDICGFRHEFKHDATIKIIPLATEE